jgi:hypothetical protein
MGHGIRLSSGWGGLVEMRFLRDPVLGEMRQRLALLSQM